MKYLNGEIQNFKLDAITKINKLNAECYETIQNIEKETVKNIENIIIKVSELKYS